MNQEQTKKTIFLSRDISEMLKGIFTCMVLLSHLHGRVLLFSNSLLGTVFSAFGYLAVSGFFFLSGYGLYIGQLEKENYERDFVRKRILPYYAICISAIFIYLVRDFLIGNVNWIEFIQSFFFGRTIVDNGWYLQAQLFLYFAFYVAFAWTKSGIQWVTLFTVVYGVICAACGLASTWYESVLCFTIGLLCAKYKSNIIVFLGQKKKVSCVVILCTLFFATLFFGNKTIFPDVVRIPIKIASACTFVTIVMVMSAVADRKVSVLSWIGKKSLSIYVLQGLFLKGFRTVIKNDWLYILVVVFFVTIAAIVVQPFFNWIYNIIRLHSCKKLNSCRMKT